MIKELRRLFRLTIQTYKIFGIRFLTKEIARYLIHGPLPMPNIEHPITCSYKKEYTSEEIEDIKKGLSLNPKISIITPVFNVDPAHLNQCILSVLAQHYSNWELCLYDDCSTRSDTLTCLKSWENSDQRIKVSYGNRNLHISQASNQAVALVTGEYIACLDHDDELAPIALLRIAEAISKQPDVGLIYSDEDLINQKGEYFNPHFKSDFNLPLLLSHNYITHLLVIKKELGDQVSWFRSGFEGAQDHDLILRVIEKTNHIYHIPEVLYHWRQTEVSTSVNFSKKSYADTAARNALLGYAKRNHFEAEVLDGPGLGVYRLKRSIHNQELVSIIIPFKDQVGLLKDCVESLLQKTTYPNYELILVSNNSEESATFRYLEKLKNKESRVRIFEHNVPFNFSAINNWAVDQARGEYILLLNNDMKVINSGWLEAMLEQIQLDQVGVVGAKLLYADNTIQHAGVIIGILGVAGHSHRFFPDTSIGYFYRPVTTQYLSAVTGACLLTKKSLWKQVGGLDEENFKIAFNDIDYCLKIRELGYNVVYTPYAKLYHYESKSRGPEDTRQKRVRFTKESSWMVRKWKTNQVPDPYYNINLTLEAENFGLKNRSLE